VRELSKYSDDMSATDSASTGKSLLPKLINDGLQLLAAQNNVAALAKYYG